MLNRVRDFRYEDVKNWKPLVSLRESYRRENGIRNFVLFGICILSVLFAYSVISGSIRFSGKPTAARTPETNPQTPNGDVARNSAPLPSQQTQDARHASDTRQASAQQSSDTRTPSSAPNVPISEMPIRSGGNMQAAKIPVVGAPPRTQTNPNQLVDYQQDRSSSTNQTARTDAARSSVSRSKIAVCDVQRIVNRDVAALTDELIAAAEMDLRDHQAKVYNSAAQFSDADLFILEGLFEQKKAIAAAQIRESTRQYRAAIEQQLRSIADRIAVEYHFDLVLTTDQVLSFTDTSDITAAVQQAWALQRQNQQTARNFETGRH